MFDAGELVVYGCSGVYRVESVGKPDISGCGDKDYYTMTPVFGTGTSYVPVDTTVFMRKVMSADEADRLIESIPQITQTQFCERNPKAIKEHYLSALKSHDCTVLVAMIKEIYLKGEKAKSSNKKLSRIDQQYMTQAEDLLYGELAVALGIPKEDIPHYIKKKIEG